MLTGFNGATQSFQVQIGGNNSAVLGAGGLAISNANVAAAVNAIPGFAGTVASAGAGNGGFTLTFSRRVRGHRRPGGRRSSTARARARARSARPPRAAARSPSWPAGGTVAVSAVTDAGYTLDVQRRPPGHRRRPALGHQRHRRRDRRRRRDDQGHGRHPAAGATGIVAAWGGAGALERHRVPGDVRRPASAASTPTRSTLDVTGATGFVGETAQGGPIENKGFIITATGNHAPVVDDRADATRSRCGRRSRSRAARTDSDGDTLTYMWEQNDRGAAAGTALVNNTKTNGPLFRQFGTAANVSATDTLLTPSPGLNAVTTDPTRVFPDIGQIVANNTNAITGTCPTAPAAPAVVPHADPGLLLGVPADRPTGSGSTTTGR